MGPLILLRVTYILGEHTARQQEEEHEMDKREIAALYLQALPS